MSHIIFDGVVSRLNTELGGGPVLCKLSETHFFLMPCLDFICARLIWGYFEASLSCASTLSSTPTSRERALCYFMPHATNDALVLKLERAVSLESPSGKTAQPGTKVCGSERQRWAR